MKPEDLLYAVREVNDEAVNDARFGEPVRHGRGLRRAVTIALAAALLLAMSVTVVAYVGAGDWFKAFFTHLNSNLTQGQQQFIDDSAVEIGESITCEGYTLTLESVIMDSQRLYAKVVIQAPEDVDLKTARCDMYYALYVEVKGEKYYIGRGGSIDEMYTDRMGESNVLTMMIEQFIKLPDEVYAKDPGSITYELLVGNLNFASILEPEKTWTLEGEWNFCFQPKYIQSAKELLDEPISIMMGDVDCEWNSKEYSDPQKYGKTWMATLQSIQITPMGMYAICERPDANERGLWYGYGNYARVVMDDGTIVDVRTLGASKSSEEYYEEWFYDFLAPVDLSKADYLEFEDGTKIPIN